MSTRSPGSRGQLAALPPPRRDPIETPQPQQELQPVYLPQPQPQPAYLPQPIYVPQQPLAPESAPPQRRLTLGGVIIALVVAAVVAGAVDKGSQHLSPTYQANASFVVSIPTEGGLNDATVTAANDTATQYAQLATSAPVIVAAAKTLKIDPGDLAGKIQGSTIAAQNIVQVTASAPTAKQASQWAEAVDVSLVNYVRTLEQSAGADFQRNATVLLAPIDAQIAALRKKIAKEPLKFRGGDQNELQTLVGAQTAQIGNLATDTAGSQPSLKLVTGGASASQTAPKPTEYALIAFVVTLLIALRVVYTFGTPRLGRRRK